MATPTRKLPFRKNMGYGGEKRCVICSGFLPYHHGFCDGSVGTVINETMLQEAERIQLSSGHLVRSLTGELYACTDCGHVLCSCNSCSVCAIALSVGELYQNVAGVRFCKAHYEADALAEKTKAPSGQSHHVAPSDAPTNASGQPKWTQEGVPEGWICTEDVAPIHLSHMRCAERATWHKATGGPDGRCDKHPPKVTLKFIKPLESFADAIGKAATKATKDLEKMARLFPLPAAKPIDRPGWEAREEQPRQCYFYRHASGATVWFDVDGDPMWAQGTGFAGTPTATIDNAFAAAEKAIEDSGWRPQTFRASMADADIYQRRGEPGGVVGKFVQIGNPHKHHWAWRDDPADRWMPAESMVEAFALAEAAR